MIRTLFALLLSAGLVGVLIYLAGLLPAPAATQTVKQTIDNHTTVIVNMPPDNLNLAIIILAVAVLLFVVARYVLPAIKDWRKDA